MASNVSGMTHIANDTALTSVNDARLGAFAAPNVARHQSHAAGPAVAGATVVGKIDTVT